MRILYPLQITLETLREEIKEKVIKEVIPAQYLDEKTVIHINPCGVFIIGGPQVRNLMCSDKKSNRQANNAQNLLH